MVLGLYPIIHLIKNLEFDILVCVIQLLTYLCVCSQLFRNTSFINDGFDIPISLFILKNNNASELETAIQII